MESDNAVREGSSDPSLTDRPWLNSYPQELRSRSVSAERTAGSLARLSEEGAQLHGEKAAVSIVLPQGAHVSLSFSQIDRLSSQLAQYFVHVAQLRMGDVVAIQLPNSLHHVIASFGAWKAGLVVTNVNPLYTSREVVQQLKDSSAKLLIASEQFHASTALILEEVDIPVLVTSLADFFPDDSANFIRRLLVPADLEHSAHSCCSFVSALSIGATYASLDHRHHPVALFQYTGGTTGRSKGAVITHHQMLTTLAQTEDYLRAFKVDMGCDDTVLTVIPLYHIFAFTLNFLLFYRLGAENLLVPNPRPLSNIRPAFEFFNITWMTGVDTLYAGLLNESWFKEDRPIVKFAISGGASLRPSTARAWRETVGPIVEGYGLTETCCVVAFNPPGDMNREGTVGLPVPGLDIRVVNDQGGDVPLGQAGELWVRGDSVIQGYLNRPGETVSAFDAGWFKTGDVVTMDADGYISIVDRVKDMINVSGFNVYPNEVEAVISELDAVAEVAVVSGRSGDETEFVKAVVVRRNMDLQEADVIGHCRQHLTGYKVPRTVEFLDALPKSTVGKILRNQLR